MTAARPGSRLKEPIPSNPFMVWIEDRIAHHRRGNSIESAHAITRVVREIGWDGANVDAGTRRLYRYRYGRSETRRGQVDGKRGPLMVLPMPFFERSVVEDALHHAGFDLSDVYPPEQYPALYTDIAPEPEAWCPNCQRSQQPVLGHCVTCDWRISDPRAMAA